MENILPIDRDSSAGEQRLIAQAMEHLASSLAPAALERERRERLRARVTTRVIADRTATNLADSRR